MEIVIHSLLENVQKFNSALHIRYYTRAHASGESMASDRECDASNSSGGSTAMTSYVIIRREYSYLEPLIRSIFKDANDVIVLIDRRAADSRHANPPDGRDRRNSADRRSSTPMLDILINVPSES